jgi:DnaJ family protein C protein 1
MRVRVMVVAAVLALLASPTSGYSQELMELYDLVEEVGTNFYEKLDLQEDATTSQIRKAFRTKSVTLHPDKNDAPDAEIVFRQIVAIVEVLKSSEMRGAYDDVLANGIPQWAKYNVVRSAFKMSTVQALQALLFIVTVMSYFANWASYLERYMTWSSAMAKRSAKRAARDDGDAAPDPNAYGIHKPRVVDIFWISFIVNLPSRIAQYSQDKKDAAARAVQEADRVEKEVFNAAARAEKDAKKAEEQRVIREAKAAKVIEVSTSTAYNAGAKGAVPIAKEQKIKLKKGAWTDAECSHLVKSMNRFPGGSINRWDRVAEDCQRSVKDVMRQAQAIKTGVLTGKAPEKEHKVTDSKGREVEAADTTFDQKQQKQLEDALRSVPKDAGDRWDQIAAQVDGKTKKQCKIRVKELMAYAKKK